MSTHKDQGLSLLDIGPLSEDVPVAEGRALKVYGVSAKGVFALFKRFPNVGQWFKGGKIDGQGLIAEVPEAIAAIIAAGCGEPGNPQAEEAAEKMSVEVQLDVIEAIARLTFKSGFGPFVQRIVALSKQAESLNYGRVSATTSPAASKPASPQATEPSSSGT